MADLDHLRQRSARLFSRLRSTSTRGPRRAAAGPVIAALEEAAPAHRRFSAFDPEHAQEAAGLALALSLSAWRQKSAEDGLCSALDLADAAAEAEDPELVDHALALFITHDRRGRRLDKPRSPADALARFAPRVTAQPTTGVAALAEEAEPAPAAPAEPTESDLDFWREDLLANEHHQHWHEVYPTAGLPPEDWNAWAASAEMVVLVEIFAALDPNRDWAAVLPTVPRDTIADALRGVTGQLIEQGQWRAFLRSLSPRAYAGLLHLNHRHGELFIYMHQQMLARYDAERLALGLGPVTALVDLDQPIPESYAPPPWLEAEGFRKRLPDRTLEAAASNELSTWRRAILDAVDPAIGNGQFVGGTGGPVPIDRDNLGQVAEAVAASFRAKFDIALYGNWHNLGHNHLSNLSELEGPTTAGVMASTATAIRDPVFWRWHKAIDDAGFAWQETRPPYDWAAEALPVLLRAGLDPAAPRAGWASPDLILCRLEDLPGHDDPDFLASGGPALGEAAFGGPAWEQDFTENEVTLPDGTTFPTVAELRSERRAAELTVPAVEGEGPWTVPVSYLSHERFCWFLRVENQGGEDLPVTVRVFLAPEATAADRRTWIELDKLATVLPAGRRTVLFRADEESSVVKKPVDRALEPSPGNNEAYCDCGWPYRLLLPSSREEGMAFRLLVFLSDGRRDQVSKPGKCGSMSFCGARDRYPDERDMGFPFSRPFATSIEGDLLALPNAAGRAVTLRRTVVP